DYAGKTDRLYRLGIENFRKHMGKRCKPIKPLGKINMFYRKILFLFPVILALALNSMGQNASTSKPQEDLDRSPVLELSLRQAVDIAISPDGDTRVRIAEELVKQAKARSVQSRAALLPHIEASVGQQNTTRNLEAFGIRIEIPLPEYNPPSFVGPFNVFDARATGALNVLNLSSIRRYQASRKGVGVSEYEQENLLDQVRNTVAHSYLSLLKAKTGEEAARSAVALAERLVTLAEDQKTAGTGTGIEIIRARVQLANEQQRLLSAVNAVNQARFQLLRTLGLNLDLRVEPTERMEYEKIAIRNPHEAIQVALQSRADWKAQQEREETARLNHSATRMERLPSVNLFADYGAGKDRGSSQAD
ncbi:MAG: TolC family protein, partial [Acidobacteriota bacterium]